jgi:phosphoribosyl 1,2-cyclic phosphate phosphodiesterase
MRIEFLGTGGASTTPRPCCECRICAEARARGVPYSRMGPAIFVRGPDLLIDTPEDIALSLNRAGVRRVGAATWSHWHPDHTAGSRVFELLNLRLWHWPPQNHPTPVYLSSGVKDDFDRHHGLRERLDYLEELGVVQPHIVPEGESFTLGSVTVHPFKLPAPTASVYAFLVTEGKKCVLIAPDELIGWQPPPSLGHLDLAILPTGIFEFDPISGERRVPAGHPALTAEATFRQTLDMVRALDADRVLFVHIEEYDGTSYDDLLRLQRTLGAEQRDLRRVMFAFDRLSVNV